MTQTNEQIYEEVQKRYSQLAVADSTADTACCSTEAGSGSCCTTTADVDKEALYGDLYTADTTWLPTEVTGLSLGCGDPITLAGLGEGLTVLDLGSGGGIDAFMAARQVGPEGRVIGVDMTPEMLAKANRNRDKVGLENVEFRAGRIEALPVDDDTVDVIISNCVINLSPDKQSVFREAYRVLAPGGRLAVSDMMTRGQFTEQERADMSAWAECVTGADDVADYVEAMRLAGFEDISIRDKARPENELAAVMRGEGPAELFSARVTAIKPA